VSLTDSLFLDTLRTYSSRNFPYLLREGAGLMDVIQGLQVPVDEIDGKTFRHKI
jgi:hypothetical protein